MFRDKPNNTGYAGFRVLFTKLGVYLKVLGQKVHSFWIVMITAAVSLNPKP